ncbi:MAG TPA: periplasmic heavy metal sensor [bacterium]
MVNRIILVISIAGCAWAAQELTNKTTLAIKGMSVEEVQGYLAGHGMGFAKAAELNQHPGPKHVLELADPLQLTKEQIERTQTVYNEMHAAAVQFGKLYVEKEAALDSLFLHSQIDEPRLRKLVSEIERLRADLRFVHLRAHLETKTILSDKQIAEYDRLRGYSRSQNKNYHQGHH